MRNYVYDVVFADGEVVEFEVLAESEKEALSKVLVVYVSLKRIEDAIF